MLVLLVLGLLKILFSLPQEIFPLKKLRGKRVRDVPGFHLIKTNNVSILARVLGYCFELCQGMRRPPIERNKPPINVFLRLLNLVREVKLGTLLGCWNDICRVSEADTSVMRCWAARSISLDRKHKIGILQKEAISTMGQHSLSSL
jgi:hypothetical protein